MASGNSIYDIKKGFLSSQLRILDGALKPKENWQDKLPEGEHGDLSEGVLNQVLYKRRLPCLPLALSQSQNSRKLEYQLIYETFSEYCC